jgi:hypothetical protein
MLLNTPDRERGVREEGAAVGEEKKRGRRLRGARGDQACCAHEGSDGEREYRSRQLRARDSNPHSLRKNDGQRGGDSEEEPTAYLIW